MPAELRPLLAKPKRMVTATAPCNPGTSIASVAADLRLRRVFRAPGTTVHSCLQRPKDESVGGVARVGNNLA